MAPKSAKSMQSSGTATSVNAAKWLPATAYHINNFQTTTKKLLTIKTHTDQQQQRHWTPTVGVSNRSIYAFDLIWRGVVGDGSRCPSCDWWAAALGCGVHL